MTRRTLNRLALALALLVAPGISAQPAPYRRWSTMDTPHFRVHVSPGLEREGRVAAAAAEKAYAQLARELVAPRGPIELVVSDDADYANGFATPYPSNRIVVFATPPVEATSLSLTEDWIGEVVTHELTHVFHLDRARGVWGGAQRVFGRAIFLFPNIYSPSWLTEGLAVYYESRLTAGGRLRSAEHRTWARAAALESALPHLGDLSASTPRFPGGNGVYGYGSLFMEYLANTYGDSTIPRFVERQSGALVPLLQDGAARRAFGRSLSEAFNGFRDSVQRTVARSAPPIANWREVTTHPWYAEYPRWVDETTLVYTASDGRETTAAYRLDTRTGERTRLGRRSGAAANSPLPGGGLLFAQLEYTGTDEVRSDLYVEEADGHIRRLTHGARLIQPDASRRDGRIVAVELGASRSSLVLLDREAQGRRVLREAGPDETWSEPRWSPLGTRIVAARRLHGGEERIEIIDVASGASCVAARGEALLQTPAWVGEGAIVYLSERSGSPQIERVSDCGAAPDQLSSAASGIVGLDVNPFTGAIAAVLVRADGHHIGVAPGSQVPPGAAPPVSGATRAPSRDTQPVFAGAYRPYSPLATLRPTWWLPILEGGAAGGTRLGAITGGNDVVGRHAYGAYAAVETSGSFATGEVSYRYSGLRRPYLDASLYQDWTDEGRILSSTGTPLGNVLKRTQDLSLAATFARPRIRSYASLSAGLGVERRRFATEPAALLAELDPAFARDYTYPRAFVSATFGNAQRPRLSISPEDGVSLAATVRERYRTDDAARTRSMSAVATTAAYRALDLGGFAHHVLALRAAGGWADAHSASAFEVGGTNGASVDVAPGVNVGEGRRTFGVRGFPAASLYGTRAAAGSLELRGPLVLGGVGSWPVPAFFDRSSASVFVDAASAGCAHTPLYLGICSPAGTIGRTIASVGAEVGISAALLQYDSPELVRVGVAVPIAGRAAVEASGRAVRAASLYVAFGQSF